MIGLVAGLLLLSLFFNQPIPLIAWGIVAIAGLGGWLIDTYWT